MPVWFLTSVPGPCSSPLLWYETWIFLISIVFALINEDSVPETLHHCAHLSSRGAWLVFERLQCPEFFILACGHYLVLYAHPLWGWQKPQLSVLYTESLMAILVFLFSALSDVLFLSSFSSHRRSRCWLLPTEEADVGSTRVVHLPVYLWPIHFNFVLHGDSWSSGLVIYDY